MSEQVTKVLISRRILSDCLSAISGPILSIGIIIVIMPGRTAGKHLLRSCIVLVTLGWCYEIKGMMSCEAFH